VYIQVVQEFIVMFALNSLCISFQVTLLIACHS